MRKGIVRAAVGLGLAIGLLPVLDLTAYAERVAGNHSEPGRL